MVAGRRWDRDFGDLLERETEKDATHAAIRRMLAADGMALAFDAPAGLGKTSLLSAAARACELQGARVLWSRAVELEHDLAYGAVRQLLLPELLSADAQQRADLLRGAAGLAGVVLGVAGGPPSSDPTAAALHGLHWLCVNLAERGPHVLVLDDAHWADTASLRFIAYLARRLEGLPVLLLLAMRSTEPGIEPGRLEQVLDDAEIQVLRPRPLSEAATTTLVRRRLGSTVSDRVCQASHRTTGGNPFLLGELLRALEDEGVNAATANATVIERIGPEPVARSVLVRLARLPPPALELARATSVFPDGADVRHLASVLSIDYGAATRAADQLAAAGVLAPGRPLAFLHPVMRSAVYEDLAAGERALLHLRVASLSRAEGAAPGIVATHLLATEAGADPLAFQDLVVAGGAALAGGAPEAACRYLDRALKEPVDPAVAARAHHLRGAARMLAGDTRAVDDLRVAAATATEPALQASALRDLGRVLAFGFESKAAVEALDGAIELGAGGNEDLFARWVVDRVWVLWSHEETGHRFVSDMESMTVPPEPDGFLELALSAYAAFWESWRCGDARQASGLARRALRDGLLAREGFDGLPPVALGSVALALADQPGPALASMEASLEVHRATGTLTGLTYAHMITGMIRLYAGELPEAESDLQVGAELAQGRLAGALGEAANRALSAVVALERAGSAQAEHLLAGLATPPTWLGLFVHAARGRVHLAAGRPDAAVEDFEAALCSARSNGLRHPLYPFPWHGDMVRAREAVGDHQRALALAEQDVDVARRFGSAAVLGEALRVAGLARGGDEGLALLEEAAATLTGSTARLLRARALADLGAALRRANHRQAARPPLQLAADLAGRCGAHQLLAHAVEELKAAGARPRRHYVTGAQSLTPSERRVARLASEGLTNRQIAQKLFLTVRTIEMHMTSALAKLGVTSRRDIGAVLRVEADETNACQPLGKVFGPTP